MSTTWYNKILSSMSSSVSSKPSTKNENKPSASTTEKPPSSSSKSSSQTKSTSSVANASDDENPFIIAYDCAKKNKDWPKVVNALTTHPDWISKIPEGRRWTMLHQIVFAGNVPHLNEALALQINNSNFRLLCKAADGKTVHDVAKENAQTNEQMLQRIEQLIELDDLLNETKEHQLDSVKQRIREQPSIVNEKPPYRRFYLAHHLAYIGDLHTFKELIKICQFKLDLLAENKTILQVAKENKHVEFANYVDELMANGNLTPEVDPIEAHHYSPGFYEDPGITFIPLNVDLSHLFPKSNHGTPFSTMNHHQAASLIDTHHNYGYPAVTTHSLYLGASSTNSMPTTMSTNHNDHQANNFKKSTDSKPKMADQSQTAYEKTVTDNVKTMTQDNLLKSITCCITREILRDPVVAADGFTYEREAICKWFETSNRSPMTNQELDSLELKPNYAIKSILEMLQNTNSLPTVPDKKNPKKA